MLFKRKIEKEFYAWKNSLSIKKRALVIKGLRQVGKTTLVQEFSKANYESVVYINFQHNKSIKAAFDKDLIVDEMTRDISAAIINARFIPYKTVIIFDELQDCPNARTAIKPFMLDGRYDVIATGSMLGLRGYDKSEESSIPTGFERTLTMYPMDFEEYLWAKGISEDVINYIKDCFEGMKVVSEPLNKTMMNHFKEYLCVGGMPDAVNTFLLTHDMNQTYEIKRDILEEYKDDFGKHLDKNGDVVKNETNLEKIMQVYNSIPAQLAKENKKFQYSDIAKNASAREYFGAITWLEEFGLINLCYNLNIIDKPLEGNKIDNQFKIYVADTGLFIAMLDRGIESQILNGDFNDYKGAIYENVIADAFSKKGKKLFYFNKNLEIDFISTYKNKLTAIEVKSTNNNAKALKTLLKHKEKYNVEYNLKLIDGNIGSSGDINTIPLYMSFLI